MNNLLTQPSSLGGFGILAMLAQSLLHNGIPSSANEWIGVAVAALGGIGAILKDDGSNSNAAK